MSFITSRLSKDNFWNLITFVSMTLTVLVGEQMNSSLVLIAAITVVPYVISLFNRVQYSKTGIFTNSQGKDLSDRLPRRLGMVMAGVIVLGVCTGIDLYTSLPHGFAATCFFIIISAFPFVYFIFINCPVAIMCSKNAYRKEVSGIVPCDNSSFISQSKAPSFYDNPGYSNMPGNKYYSSLGKR